MKKGPFFTCTICIDAMIWHPALMEVDRIRLMLWTGETLNVMTCGVRYEAKFPVKHHPPITSSPGSSLLH